MAKAWLVKRTQWLLACGETEEEARQDARRAFQEDWRTHDDDEAVSQWEVERSPDDDREFSD